MEKIYAGVVDEISEVIKGIAFASSDYMILEKVDDIKFENFDLQSFENWEKGIIFSENKEFKWRRIDEKFHVVFSGNDVSHTILQLLDEEAQADTEGFPVILWGQQSPEMQDFQENEYVELPIPKILSYPIKSKYRVKIILKVQKNENDEIIGYRFSGISEEAKQ